MSAMTYRGYAASIEYSEEDGCFVGHIAGIRDRVGFHGESVGELRSAFEEAVDDYLQTCRTLGRAAQEPDSGSLVLRARPDIHAALAVAAERRGLSLDRWAAEILESAAR